MKIVIRGWVCGTRIGTAARAEDEVVLAWLIVHLGSWSADVLIRWDCNVNIGAWDTSKVTRMFLTSVLGIHQRSLVYPSRDSFELI